MRILAIDPSSVLGWAAGDSMSNSGAPARFGTYRQRGDRPSVRLLALQSWLIDRIKAEQVEAVYFEAPILPAKTSIQSMLSLAGNAVVIGMASAQCGVNAYPVMMQSWRSSFGVPTQAPRKIVDPGQRRQWVKQQTIQKCRKLGLEIQNDNEADAIGIWCFARNKIEQPVTAPQFDFAEGLTL